MPDSHLMPIDPNWRITSRPEFAHRLNAGPTPYCMNASCGFFPCAHLGFISIFSESRSEVWLESFGYRTALMRAMPLRSCPR